MLYLRLRVGEALYGRTKELAEARQAVARALASGGVLLLSGEPGIGKSRLADELARLAIEQGAQVHYGRGWEGGGAPAWWPWTEALGSLFAGLDAAQLGALVGEDAPELVRLVPALRSRLSHLVGASLPDADEGRFRLAFAVGATLKRAASVKPLVVVLDDLHTADASTLTCLVAVARAVKGSALLLLGTYREAEARLSPALSGKLGVLAREATNLHLAALERGAALELVHARGGLSAAQAESIADAAGGNPLFLSEMSRLVAATGSLSELPLGVKESIRQRLVLLPAEATQLLEVASCAGREIDPPLLAAALGQPGAAVLAQLQQAIETGMVMRRSTGGLSFSHDLVREVLYRGLEPTRRLQLHQRLAHALERPGRRSPESQSAIARHLLEAAELDPGAAVRAAIEAAGGALQLVAYEEALALLERAQAVTRTASVEPKLLAQLWTTLGEARLRAGQLDAARQACAEAAAIARGLGDVELLAAAALTFGSEIQPGTIDADLVEWLQEARQGLGEGHPLLKARVLARLAAALQPSPRPMEPVALAKEAIALARESGDERTLLEVLHAAMAAMMDYVDPHERLPLNLEQEALARRFHDRPRELRARLRLVFDYLVMGDIGLADARAQAFDALARQLRQDRFQWFIPSWRAMRAIFEGRFEDAEQLLDEAAALTPPGALGEIRDFMQRLSLGRVAERPDGLERLVAFRSKQWADLPMGQAISSLVNSSSLCRAGRFDEARASLRETTMSFPGSPRDPTRAEGIIDADPTNLGWVGDAFSLLERPEVERAYRGLKHNAGLQGSTAVIGMTWEGPVDRVLGVLAAALGQLDTAVAHYQATIDYLERTGGRGLLARCWFEAAELLRRRRAEGDEAQATRWSAQARALARELGQTGLLDLFASRVPEQPAGAAVQRPTGTAVPTPAAPAPGEAAFSLKREGDYWEISGGKAPLRLKDSRGLQLLARLVERPDTEVHCLELASDGPRQELDAGDAGEWLDPSARRQYQQRVVDLRDTVREAEEFGDPARAEKARAELDFIAQELSRGVGLGGRGRKAASASERARVAVQRRLKDAVTRISEHDSALGQHLEWAVKTGTYCCFRTRR